jgi:replicative DNA helicase
MFTIQPKPANEILQDYNFTFEANVSLLSLSPREVIPTCISGIDDCMQGGFRSGTLNIITARPGTGKTMFALNIAINMAAAQKKVLFISTEMSPEELMPRVYALLMSGDEINYQLRADVDNTTNVIKAHALFEATIAPYIHFVYWSHLDEINYHLSQKGSEYDAVFIDHVHCLDIANERLEGVARDMHIIRALKTFWKTQKGCLICVAQPNKNTNLWADMNNISGSAQWSQLASQIIYLAESEAQKEANQNREPGVPESLTLVFAKQRYKGMNTRSYHYLRFYKWKSKVEYFRPMGLDEIKKLK